MKIYVASSWRNIHQPMIVELLRRWGHDVYDFKNPTPGNTGFAWSAIDENWQHWSVREFKIALEHPIAKRGFNSDFDAMEAAECCVLVLPCGRSAHSEAGYMAGKGKTVIVYITEQQEPELMYKIYDSICDGVDRLEDIFRQ